MDVNDLYGFVLTLVLVGVLLGVGLVVLTKLTDSSAVQGTTASVAINNTIDEIGTISSDWLGVVVVVVIAAIVIGLVVRSFGAQRS